MIAKKPRTAADERREKLRNEFWPHEDPWTGGKTDFGWFQAPRALPLILTLLNSKELSGKCNPSSVYIELLARHMSQGVIEMEPEADHAYAAGYSRRIRSWEERVKILEKAGFIKTKRLGGRYRLVLLVHPTTAVHRLRQAGKVPEEWWDAYRARQTEVKAPSYEEREKAKEPPKVVPIKTVKQA